MKRWNEMGSLAYPVGAWGRLASKDCTVLPSAAIASRTRCSSGEKIQPNEVNELILQATSETLSERPRETAWRTESKGVPTRHVLAVLSHCYIRGFYNSNDVAEELQHAAEFQGQHEQPWPDAAGIRRFRRVNRELLLKSLERIFCLFGQRRILWPMVSIQDLDTVDERSAQDRPGCEYREAQARLEHAILHDRPE